MATLSLISRLEWRVTIVSLFGTLTTNPKRSSFTSASRTVLREPSWVKARRGGAVGLR